MGTEIFYFIKICANGSCLKRVPIKVFRQISSHLFSNPNNLCLEWTFLDIFCAHNICLAIGFLMVTEIFGFGPNLTQFFLQTSNPPNLALEWTFWTLSVLNMIVLMLAIWWTLKFLYFWTICAFGSCSRRVPTKAYRPDIEGGASRFYFGMLPTKCSH